MIGALYGLLIGLLVFFILRAIVKNILAITIAAIIFFVFWSQTDHYQHHRQEVAIDKQIEIAQQINKDLKQKIQESK